MMQLPLQKRRQQRRRQRYLQEMVNHLDKSKVTRKRVDCLLKNSLAQLWAKMLPGVTLTCPTPSLCPLPPDQVDPFLRSMLVGI